MQTNEQAGGPPPLHATISEWVDLIHAAVGTDEREAAEERLAAELDAAVDMIANDIRDLWGALDSDHGDVMRLMERVANVRDDLNELGEGLDRARDWIQAIDRDKGQSLKELRSEVRLARAQAAYALAVAVLSVVVAIIALVVVLT